MVESNPGRKVGLVTFTDDVKIIGDGTTITSFSSSQLNDYNFMMKNGVACSTTLDEQKDFQIRRIF